MTSLISSMESKLSARIATHAGEYFPCFAEANVTVELVRSFERRFSHGYEFVVSHGGQSRGIFAKVPVTSSAHCRESAPGNENGIGDRPRLTPVLSVADEARIEHTALRAMQNHFANFGGKQFGIPRVLDELHEGALFVEAIQLPTLDRWLGGLRMGCLRGRRLPMDAALLNAGKWLRTLHSMSPPAGSRTRLSTRCDVLEKASEFAQYLHQYSTAAPTVDRLKNDFVRRAHRDLPPECETVIGHGDYGPHNLFANEQGNIIGFDTLAHWQTSPLEDVAYFLLLMENPPPLFVSRDVRQPKRLLRKLRSCFLRGYFDSTPVPLASLRLYETLVAMDKWVSVVHSARRAGGIKRLLKRSRLALQQQAIIRRLRRLQNDAAWWESGTRITTCTRSATWRPAT